MSYFCILNLMNSVNPSPDGSGILSLPRTKQSNRKIASFLAMADTAYSRK